MGGGEGGGLSGRRRTAVPAELPSRAVTASSARSLSGRRVRESSFLSDTPTEMISHDL